jgi:hypothetical protein
MNPPSPTPDLDLRLSELRHALDELRRRSVIDTLALANWRAASAMAGVAEIAEGDPWPPGDPVVFERHTVTVPAEWPLADVRLDLDPGCDGDVRLHSRLGQERHRVGPGRPWLPVPTRAFGIRLEAQPSPAETGDAPRFGRTCLVRLHPQRLALHTRLSAEADAVGGALAAGAGRAALEARLAAVQVELASAGPLAPAASRAG